MPATISRLRSSKVVNLRNRIIRRRLGHTGPEPSSRRPRNVVAVDCDDFNSRYDRFGHSYFLADPQGQPGALLRHLMMTMLACWWLVLLRIGATCCCTKTASPRHSRRIAD